MKAYTDRSTHIRNWMMFLEDYPVILAPTTVQPTPGPRADIEEGRDATRSSSTRCASSPRSTCLVCRARSCLSSLDGGHPIGVQLIAGRYREDLALDAAQAIEDEVGTLVKTLWARESH